MRDISRLSSQTGKWLAGLLPVLLVNLARADAVVKETTGTLHWWLPQDVSTFGPHVDQLFYIILVMTSVTCVGVFALLLYFLFKYRHTPDRSAQFIHGNNKLEMVWTLIPTVILALTAAFSESTWSEIKYPSSLPSGKDVVEVEVVAQQFLWTFHYPGKDGKFGKILVPNLINPDSGDPAEQIGLDRRGDGADDIVSPKMVIPVNTKVLIHLHSRDVIHSFYLPNFRLKQDAVPGLNIRLWLEATKTSAEVVGCKNPADALPGDDLLGYAKPFYIECAQLCGQGHYKMRGQLYVVSQKQYQQFLAAEAKNLGGAGGESY